MIDHINLHLRAKARQSRESLHKFLIESGYKSEDDFYFLLRDDHIEEWQSDELISIDLKVSGTKIADTEEEIDNRIAMDWDEIIVTYLLVNVPSTCIKEMLDQVQAISKKFGLNIFFDGKLVSVEILATEVEKLKNSLESEYAHLGSEEIIIASEMQYGD